MPRITKRTVTTAKPKPGKAQTYVWDSDFPGFALRIARKGRKTFVFQYRNAQHRTRRLTLGAASRLTAEAARGKARLAAAAVEKGEDPAETRLEARRGLTMAELAERYMEEHARTKKKASSAALDERLLRRCILPHLAGRKVAEVSGSAVRSMHHALRKTPVQANRALLLLSKMMNLAESWGYRPPGSNPCQGVDRYPEKPRQRFLSGDELARVGAALAEAEREASAHPSGILALRLLLLTGARSGEILSLRWSEIDFERRCLQLEDSKSGEKTIPLGAPALRLLAEAPRMEGNPYVCFGVRPGRPLGGLTKIWYRIRRRAGLEDVRIHDLRHSFASVGAGSGLGLPIIGALLGHSQPQTTHRYAHVGTNPVQLAAERISEEIAARMGTESGEVRRFRQKGS